MRRASLICAGALLCAGAAMAAYSPGQLVDDFTLPAAQGGNLTLSQYDGRVIHLWFFTAG